MEILGKIKVINPTQNVSASFKKRELVVVTNEQYPQSILIEFAQDKCDILDNYQVGQNVKVGINLRGREWVNPQGETKYFNSIQGWNISKDESTSQEYKVDNSTYEKAEPKTNRKEEEHDDLPF